MYTYFNLNTFVLLLIPFVASYDFFFLYADRDHDGKIDINDIERIRNPAWLREWNSFDISKFLPIGERDFQLFIEELEQQELIEEDIPFINKTAKAKEKVFGNNISRDNFYGK